MTERDPQRLRSDTLEGLKWSFVSQAVSQVLTLGLAIVLARLLTPREFGLMGMVMVLSGFGYALRDLGLGSAIVQGRELNHEALSTVFWLTLGVGMAFCGILAGLAGPIAQFYEIPTLRPLALWLSVDYLLISLNSVQEALLRRRLEFRRLMVMDSVGQVVSGSAAIGAIHMGLGVWALVIRQLTLSVTRSTVLWLGAGWRPSLVLRPSLIGGYVNFSLPLLATTALNYWTRNIDKLLIGRFLGDVALGTYSRGYAIMLYPLENVSQVVSRVMFPAYSRMEGDKAKVKRTYLRVIRAVASLTFPLMFGVAATAEPLVLGVLGKQWADLVPVLRVLAILGALQSIATMNGDIFLSQGATSTLLRVGGPARIALVACIVAGLNWGILGVAVGYTVGSFLLLLPVRHFVGRLIDVSLREWATSLAGIFMAAAFMAGLVTALDLMAVSVGWGVRGRLALAISAGGLAYASALWRLDPGAIRDAVSAIRATIVKA